MDGHAAGSYEGTGALHFNDADAAGPDFGGAVQITEGRDKDALLAGDIEDRLSRKGLDFPSVDGYSYFVIHVSLLKPDLLRCLFESPEQTESLWRDIFVKPPIVHAAGGTPPSQTFPHAHFLDIRARKKMGMKENAFFKRLCYN
jgi:hypothetical protein